MESSSVVEFGSFRLICGIDSDEVGWLVPPKNRVALAEALAEIMRDSDRAGGVGRAARARVIDSFSRNGRIEALEHLYLEVIGEKRGLR